VNGAVTRTVDPPTTRANSPTITSGGLTVAATTATTGHGRLNYSRGPLGLPLPQFSFSVPTTGFFPKIGGGYVHWWKAGR